MRSIWLIFGCLLLALLGLRFLWPRPAAGPRTSPGPTVPALVLVAQHSASPRPAPTGQRDSIVRFALRQVGTPYTWAGTSPRTGFDCSGFIAYVFGRFGVATPHATALLIEAGQPVPRAQAQPGDIVVFTGTAAGSTTPGHAGIVISARGETPLRFVHASSARRESGVKISQVEDSGYEQRFMQVRRVLGLGGNPPSTIATPPQSVAIISRPRATRPAGAEAPLPAALPRVATSPVAALPTKVAPVPVRLRPRPRASAKTTAVFRRSGPAKHATSPKRMPGSKLASGKKPIPAGRKVVQALARIKPTQHRTKVKSR